MVADERYPGEDIGIEGVDELQQMYSIGQEINKVRHRHCLYEILTPYLNFNTPQFFPGQGYFKGEITHFSGLSYHVVYTGEDNK